MAFFTGKAFGTPCRTRSNLPTRGTEAEHAKKEGSQDGDADAKV